VRNLLSGRDPVCDLAEHTRDLREAADVVVGTIATHGLVAGDVAGLGEPSLALTLPKQATELDDGLLRASEVVQLKLNADRVELSAATRPPPISQARKRCPGWRVLLLCRGAGAPHLALVGRFGGGDPAHHLDIRHHDGRSEARPRRGPARCDAGLHERQGEPAERLPGILGAVFHHR
jgi:hypothetical protein